MMDDEDSPKVPSAVFPFTMMRPAWCLSWISGKELIRESTFSGRCHKKILGDEHPLVRKQCHVYWNEVEDNLGMC